MKKHFAALFMLPAIILPMATTPTYAPLADPIPQVVVNPQPIITHRQDLFLGLLEWCESGGRPNIKILDSNNKYSYGSFMFQMDTWLKYGKQYQLIPNDISPAQAEKDIFDYETQKKIANRMLIDKLGDNWRHCYNAIHTSYPKD